MNRVLPPLLLAAALGLCVPAHPACAGETQGCVECHGEAGRERRLSIPVEEFQGSVHARRLTCRDCHTDVRDGGRSSHPTVQRVDCGRCHDQVNRHSPAAAAPECNDCHTKHAILPASNRASSLHPENLKRTCAACHPRESGRTSLAGSVLRFRPAAHRKGDLDGVFDPLRCLDCHREQAAHGGRTPSNRKACERCHDSSRRVSFPVGSFHGSAGSGWSAGIGNGEYFYFPLLLLGMAIFAFGSFRRLRLWRSGRREERSDKKVERILSLLTFGLGQKKVFEDRLAGFAHAGIVIGFVVPLAATLAVQLPFSAGPTLSNLWGLVLDLSGLCGMTGVLLAALGRGRRSKARRPYSLEAWILLGVILGILATGFLVGSGRVAAANPENASWTPVRLLLSKWARPGPILTSTLWRFHYLLVLCVIASLPYSKLRHAATAPFGIYRRNLGPYGAMRPSPLARGVPAGASHRREFTRKQLLDADACMECGRCEEQCPATAAGMPLSPRKVIRDLRTHMEKDLPPFRLRDRATSGGDGLIGERITDEEIWSCTTCHACSTACPVLVEPPAILMDLRRHLVMGESRFPPELKPVFRRLEIYADPYGKGPARRLEWASALKVKRLAEGDRANCLLWIGCEGAFHERFREVSASVAKIFTSAGLDFAVLGTEERCCGDLARRMGNEHLFRRLAAENIERLKRHEVTKIITLCPHCFHAMKSEYPQLGGEFSVEHYSTILADLLSLGRIDLKLPVPGRTVFHDPCYLGRIHGQFEPARTVLGAVPGLQLVEMERSREKSFCCGAGGGRGWMHDDPATRINRVRAEEALALRPERIVTSCPYCLGMFEDATRSMGIGKAPKILDLSEVVLQSVG